MNNLPLPEPRLPRRSRLRFWLQRVCYKMTLTRPERKLSRPFEMLICFMCLAVPAFILFPVFVRPSTGSRKNCSGNLNSIGAAMQLYAADWDERLPRADAWIDCTLHYTNSVASANAIKRYDCTLYRQSRQVAYSYAYNDMLESRAFSAFSAGAATPLCYDTRLMIRNAHASGRAGLADPPRHGSSITPPINFMVFLDGHVGKVDAMGKVIQTKAVTF